MTVRATGSCVATRLKAGKGLASSKRNKPAGFHRRPANPNADDAVRSTSTLSVTATDGHSDDDASGAIELFQPTRVASAAEPSATPFAGAACRRRHAEEAEDQGHQRCYHYSLHQVCLPFLLSSSRDRCDQRTQPIRRSRDRSDHLFNNTLALPRFHVTLSPGVLRTLIPSISLSINFTGRTGRPRSVGLLGAKYPSIHNRPL